MSPNGRNRPLETRIQQGRQGPTRRRRDRTGRAPAGRPDGEITFVVTDSDGIKKGRVRVRDVNRRVGGNPDDENSPPIGDRYSVLRIHFEATDPARTTVASSAVISPAAASHHTKVLREAGLITTERDGYGICHRITELGVNLLSSIPDGSAYRHRDRGRAPCQEIFL